jgi:hypothetical protein
VKIYGLFESNGFEVLELESLIVWDLLIVHSKSRLSLFYGREEEKQLKIRKVAIEIVESCTTVSSE